MGHCLVIFESMVFFYSVDPVRYGHILGRAGTFTSAGQRKLTLREVLIIRCLMHASMIGGAILNGNTVSGLCDKPAVSTLTKHFSGGSKANTAPHS